MTSAMPVAGKRDSVLVSLCCGLAIAISFLAIAGAFVPFLDGVAVVLSLPAMFVATMALGIALLRRTRLLLPALALLISAVPAARYNWKQMRIVWVESEELCYSPGLRPTLIGILANTAAHLDRKNAVGSQICSQLGKRFTDSDCDGPVGRMKCE